MAELQERSQRLVNLLNGETCDHPPYWEPWFCMNQMLHDHFGDSYITMANTLGHAAVPIPHVNTDTIFLADVERNEETGVWYGGGVLETEADLAAKPEPDYDAALEPMLQARQAAADAGLACWTVLGWCFHRVATSMSLEQFALATYDRPEFLKQVMHWVEARNRQAIDRVIAKVKPDFVLYDGDCAYKTGTMVQPEIMRDLTYEATKPNIDRLRELGIPVTFHSDGKLDDVIPLLSDLGFSAVHGCESAANDLQHLVETFGDQIVLCGNMDVVFLKNATPVEIEQRTQEMLNIGNAKGRFVAGCNTSPLDYIPAQNYKTFVQAASRHQPQSTSTGV